MFFRSAVIAAAWAAAFIGHALAGDGAASSPTREIRSRLLRFSEADVHSPPFVPAAPAASPAASAAPAAATGFASAPAGVAAAPGGPGAPAPAPVTLPINSCPEDLHEAITWLAKASDAARAGVAVKSVTDAARAQARAQEETAASFARRRADVAKLRASLSNYTASVTTEESRLKGDIDELYGDLDEIHRFQQARRKGLQGGPAQSEIDESIASTKNELQALEQRARNWEVKRKQAQALAERVADAEKRLHLHSGVADATATASVADQASAIRGVSARAEAFAGASEALAALCDRAATVAGVLLADPGQVVMLTRELQELERAQGPAVIERAKTLQALQEASANLGPEFRGDVDQSLGAALAATPTLTVALDSARGRIDRCVQGALTLEEMANRQRLRARLDSLDVASRGGPGMPLTEVPAGDVAASQDGGGPSLPYGPPVEPCPHPAPAAAEVGGGAPRERLRRSTPPQAPPEERGPKPPEAELSPGQQQAEQAHPPTTSTAPSMAPEQLRKLEDFHRSAKAKAEDEAAEELHQRLEEFKRQLHEGEEENPRQADDFTASIRRFAGVLHAARTGGPATDGSSK